MPVTELIIPAFIQDEPTKSAFTDTFLPELTSMLESFKGVNKKVKGLLIEENDKSVGAAFRPAQATGMLQNEKEFLPPTPISFPNPTSP